MKTIMGLALAAGIALALTTASQAQVSLNSVRVIGKDAEALGRFYAAAFGLRETRRLSIANGVELFLNFGDTVEAARANANPALVIMQTPDDPKDTVMHVIFTVGDAAATARAVKAAGGTIEREPTAFGNTGTMIGFAIDPAGNHIELIQPGSR